MNAFDWIAQVLGILAAVLAAPLFLGWVNKWRAWLQSKSAPSILMPYRGIRKLFHKDAVIAANASQLFRFAPYAVFGAMVTAAICLGGVDSERNTERTRARIAAPCHWPPWPGRITATVTPTVAAP